MNTDKDWEKWGTQDPYFGVLSSEEFRRSNLTNENKECFFRSGEEHIHQLLTIIHTKIAKDFKPIRAVDFGCGVGRIVIALSNLCHEVVGIDVAESMLSEARQNCLANGIKNVTFVKSDDQLSKLAGEYNFIHSCLVFQHISPKRGKQLISQLLSHLEPGGVFALQFFYRSDASKLIRMLVRMRYYFRILHYLRNFVRKRPFREPAMQLHCYRLDSLIDTFKAAGIDGLYLDLYQAFGFQGAMIIGQKNHSMTTS